MKISAIVLLLAGLMIFPGCGTEKKTEVIREVPAPAPDPDPDPDPGPEPEPDPQCRTGYTIAYPDIKPIITDNCTGSCHPGYDSFNVVGDRARFASFLARINLPGNDIQRMPRIPAPELSFEQKQKLAEFQADGLRLEAVCRDGSGGGSAQLLDLPALERIFDDDLDSLRSGEGEGDTRWLIASHKANAGDTAGRMRIWKKASDKAINMISQEDDILRNTASDGQNSIYRMDLSALGLTPADWALVQRYNRFALISKTRRGEDIRRRTGADIPWMHADNFIATALGIPAVYNQLLRIPGTLDELLDQLGVDLEDAFAGDFEARMACFNGSPLGNQNRMLLRLEQDETGGGAWLTFDVNDVFLEEKNCFAFPLLVVGQRRFISDASEIIFEKDNGLHGYGLFNAAGIIQEVAPVDIVRDFRSPVDSEIENGLDCMRCHEHGILPFSDAIRAHTFPRNPSALGRDDLELVGVLYKSNDTNQANVNRDNSRFHRALAKMDISTSEPDPVNTMGDEYRLTWSLADVAGFIATMGFAIADNAEADFCLKLEGTIQSKAALGQLCSGGPGQTVTLTQLENAFADVEREFRLGLDPIDQ